MSEFSEDCPRLEDIEEGDLFYTHLHQDGYQGDKLLLRKGGYCANQIFSCINEATGRVHMLPVWKGIELYYGGAPSEILRDPIDE